MIDSKDEAQLREELQSASATVKAYAGSDANNAAIAMLGILAASYVADLLRCTADQLPALQAKIAQLLALKSVFEGEEYAHPRS